MINGEIITNKSANNPYLNHGLKIVAGEASNIEMQQAINKNTQVLSNFLECEMNLRHIPIINKRYKVVNDGRKPNNGERARHPNVNASLLFLMSNNAISSNNIDFTSFIILNTLENQQWEYLYHKVCRGAVCSYYCDMTL